MNSVNAPLADNSRLMPVTEAKPPATNGRRASTPQALAVWKEKNAPLLQSMWGSREAAQQFMAIAIDAVIQNPTLKKCDVNSLIHCCKLASELHLYPGIRQECAFVPRKQKDGSYLATFMPMFKGLIKLANNAGVRVAPPEVVYSNDHFEFERGTNEYLRHKPNMIDRGEPIAVYSVARTEGDPVFVVLSVQDVEKVRASSAAKNDGPWKTHWEAMAKKTALKQLLKYLPSSEKLDRAIQIDNETERHLSVIDSVDSETQYDSSQDSEVLDAEPGGP